MLCTKAGFPYFAKNNSYSKIMLDEKVVGFNNVLSHVLAVKKQEKVQFNKSLKANGKICPFYPYHEPAQTTI